MFGVMSYLVSQRTREIGIRMALGAQPQQVAKLIVGDALRLAAAGLAIGLVTALGLARLMASLLFGVTGTDPWTIASVSLVLTTVLLVASYLPARRAAKVDPAVALRCE
jgi:putative ABC transport system permease protein